MSNRGIAPPDPNTEVGKVRFASGDINRVPLDPPEMGYGDYAIWSDDEIEAALAISGGSLARAIAILYTQLAAHWNSIGTTIRTDDLQYDTKNSVGSWVSLAAYWNKVADDEDLREANDYFDLVDVGRRHCGKCDPELAAHTFCGCRRW